MPGDKYHDLILRCGSEAMGLHRLVVCGGSRVLDKMLDSSVQHGNKSVIELPDEDIRVVRKAMRFLYTGDYDAKDISTEPDDNVESSVTVGETPLTSSALLLHVDVYAFGYHYNVAKLQELAATKFNDAVREGDAWATEVLPTLITKVYKTTPPTEKGLRDVISEVCALHVDILLPIPEFNEVMVNVPGVAMDILGTVQNLRASVGSEAGNEVVEALERQVEDCRLQHNETEKRCEEEAELARELVASLKEIIQMLEAKNKSTEEKAVKDAEKASVLQERLRSSSEATIADREKDHEKVVAELQKQIKDLKSSPQGAHSNVGSTPDAYLQQKNVMLEALKTRAFSELKLSREASIQARAETEKSWAAERDSQGLIKKERAAHQQDVAELTKKVTKLEADRKRAYLDMRSAQEACEETTAQLKSARNACARAKAETKSEIAKLDEVIQRSRRLGYCRNCEEDFNGHIERTNDGGTLVRCDECRTKNW